MNWNDDNDDFGFHEEDNWEEQKAEFERKRKARQKRNRNHPLFLQALEIWDTTHALLESMKDEREKEMYEHTLSESAMLLAPKIAGALGSDSWLLTMQNAAIIRYHAEHLLTATSGLKMLDSADWKYVQLLRDEMLHFRELFREWCLEIDKMKADDYPDDWGLFRRS
jgi:hypothetical protein